MIQTVALRRVAEIVNGGTPKADEGNWGGDIHWATPVDLAKVDGGFLDGTERSLTKEGLESGSRVVPAGSLLLSTRAPIGYVAEAVRPMAFNQGCRGVVIRDSDAVEVRFLKYQLLGRRADLQAAGNGTTFQELSGEGLGSFRVVHRPLAEQRRIANFLDAETTRIDALITAKQQMNSLLKERLDSARERVLWGAESMPLHFAVDDRRQVMYGIVLPGPSVSGAGTVAIIKGGDVAQQFRRVLNRTTEEIESKYERSRVREGDVVISIRGGIGDVALVPKEADGANLTQDVARVAPTAGVPPRWLLHVIASPGFQNQVQSIRTGATITGVNIADLKRLRIPASTPNDMLSHAKRLDRLSSMLADLSERLVREINLLRERRQALITAAVSGELDIA